MYGLLRSMIIALKFIRIVLDRCLNKPLVIVDKGRVECPVCNTIIDPQNYDGYELVEVDGSCCGDIFSVTIKCLKCGALLEVF